MQPWKAPMSAGSRDRADSRKFDIDIESENSTKDENKKNRHFPECGLAHYASLPWQSTLFSKGVVVLVVNSAVPLQLFSGPDNHCDTMPARATTAIPPPRTPPITEFTSIRTLLRRSQKIRVMKTLLPHPWTVPSAR